MKSLKMICLIMIVSLLLTSCLEAMDNDLSADNTAAPSAAADTAEPSPTSKPMVVAATKTPVVSATPTPMPSSTNTPEPTPAPASALNMDSAFFPQELAGSLYYISFGMDVAEVEQILGPPHTSQSFAYYQGFNIRHYYNHCEIAFTPRYNAHRDSEGAYVVEMTEFHDVYEIVVADPQYQGPRGIKIGDSAEIVFEKLGYPVSMLDQKKSGVIYEDDETFITISFNGNQVSLISMNFDDGAENFNISFIDGKVERYLLASHLN